MSSNPEPVPARPSFDAAETLSRLGDRALLAQMAGLFQGESVQLLAAIRDSVVAGDATALARSAHALNGSVGNFGVSESLDSARALERMGREGVLAGAGERFAMLEAQVARLEVDLAAFLAQPAEAPA